MKQRMTAWLFLVVLVSLGISMSAFSQPDNDEPGETLHLYELKIVGVPDETGTVKFIVTGEMKQHVLNVLPDSVSMIQKSVEKSRLTKEDCQAADFNWAITGSVLHTIVRNKEKLRFAIDLIEIVQSEDSRSCPTRESSAVTVLFNVRESDISDPEMLRIIEKALGKRFK